MGDYELYENETKIRQVENLVILTKKEFFDKCRIKNGEVSCMGADFKMLVYCDECPYRDNLENLYKESCFTLANREYKMKQKLEKWESLT